jgi:hypothetical protein
MVNHDEQPKKRLSRNFYVSEFACKGAKCGCIYSNPEVEPYLLVDPIFVQKLQAMRDDLEFPFKINSAARCIDHNKAVGGAKSSAHLVTALHPSRAVDVSMAGLTSEQRYLFLRAAIKYGMHGIGIYDSFIHIDNKKRKALWRG